MNLNNVYSAVIKSLKGQRVTADINELINIERLKTMYYGYEGPREIEIRFIDPRQFTASQRNFIYALLGDISRETGDKTSLLKDMFYSHFEELRGYPMSLKKNQKHGR